MRSNTRDVAYLGNLAEQPALRNASTDLVVAAQAAHWFDHGRFHREVQRILRPQGALAIWTYGLAQIDPLVDAVVLNFYHRTVGEYWPPERRYVESAYRDLPFPWQEVAVPQFQLNLQLGSRQSRGLHRHLVGGAAVQKSNGHRSTAAAAPAAGRLLELSDDATVSDLAVAPARRTRPLRARRLTRDCIGTNGFRHVIGEHFE